MKINITHKTAREVFYQGNFYETGKDIDVEFSDAVRLSRDYLTNYHTDKLPYNQDLFLKEGYFGFTSDVDTKSGWGNVSFNLLKNSKDYKPALVGKLNDIIDLDIQKMAIAKLHQDGVMIWHEQPKETWLNSPFSKNIAIIPFETTRVPASWVPRVNKMDALMVPCEQNIKMFQDSGVTIPIHLIHWGIDSKKFYPLPRDNKVFTFGHMGSLSLRKGTDILVSAFSKAFPNGENVKLICKTSQTHYPFLSKDKRIEVNCGAVSHDELLRDFFQKIDCFVFPTRGEGVGMPPMEAMATGIPAIVTDWSGPVDYMTDEIGWKLKYSMTPAKDFTDSVYKEDCGFWAEPDEQHLIELLRYAYEHQEETKQKGQNAAKEMVEKWKWEDRVGEFHEALNNILLTENND